MPTIGHISHSLDRAAFLAHVERTTLAADPHWLAQLTLIGPARGAELRALVYPHKEEH